MQSANKMCVALLFGGMSSEHEVSCVSVGNFVRNIDRSKYEVLTVGITKEGRWLYTEATAEQMADGSWEELPGNMPCVISPDRADHGMILFRHGAGSAGAGRHRLCGLRRAGKLCVHGQGRSQRPV